MSRRRQCPMWGESTGQECIPPMLLSQERLQSKEGKEIHKLKGHFKVLFKLLHMCYVLLKSVVNILLADIGYQWWEEQYFPSAGLWGPVLRTEVWVSSFCLCRITCTKDVMNFSVSSNVRFTECMFHITTEHFGSKPINCWDCSNI